MAAPYAYARGSPGPNEVPFTKGAPACLRPAVRLARTPEALAVGSTRPYTTNCEPMTVHHALRYRVVFLSRPSPTGSRAAATAALPTRLRPTGALQRSLPGPNR